MSIKPQALLFLAVLCLLQSKLFAQPSNNTCAGAQNITVTGDCTPISGDLYNATSTTITGGGCGSGRDVWYRFIQPSNSTNITVSCAITSNPTTLTNTNLQFELFNSRNCATLNSNSLGCQTNISSARTYTGLMPDSVYYLRVRTTQTPTSNPGRWNFSLCVTTNDTVSNAATIVPGGTRDGCLWGASADPSIAAGCATGNADDDIWFKFTAVYNYAVITLSSIGSNLNSSGARMQAFSGAPGSLTSIGCTSAGIFNPLTGLTPGATYYVRVYSAGTGQAGFNQAGGSFRIAVSPSAPTYVSAGRMREIYKQVILSSPQTLADPWEVTHGPDDKLWITESKGYRLYRLDPVSGTRDTVLDISRYARFLQDDDTLFNMQFDIGANNPQGGFAGMALHPKFLDPVAPNNFVYISYVYNYLGGGAPNGRIYVNRLARFTYDPVTKRLGSPVSLCDTLPGSNDHNSQRMIIAPVGGTHYLFYAQGDMGAGQFDNRLRPQKAQDTTSYEGKILRFNLETDGGSGLDGWIPNDNPYNQGSVQSAIWVTGIRNNQGFAYDSTLNILYGSSHGPYSDDEINIIERKKNYGHPLVIGYASDNNYNGSTAGAALTASGGVSTCPDITDEAGAALAITNYKDPLFSAYAQSQSVINNIWNTNPPNGGWPSEGWSGLHLYQHTLVPGWYKSLVAASLKWGRLVRIRLQTTGDTVRAIGATDTASYFGSTNRFRDLAITAGGKDIYVIMDRSATTSGPSTANPVIPACGGCVQKYSFVGYADQGGKSSLPTEIDISAGLANAVAPGTGVTINSDNSNYWVPITGPDGEIVAEIFANGQALGLVTAAFYKNTNALRSLGNTRYLDRNITINAQFAPVSPVKVRFYITKAEFDRLDADPFSHINTLEDVYIHRNTDPCQAAIGLPTSMIVPDYWDPFDVKGYVLQSDNITSLSSSFYFGSDNITLPLNLLTFTGQYKNGGAQLKWETSNEINTDHFVVERSTVNGRFDAIGEVKTRGGNGTKAHYNYTDENIAALGVPFVYYRLKVVDQDGEFTYSKVVTIQVPDLLITTINLFPNPANNETILSITSPKDQRITWQLIDNAGRTVLSNHGQVHKGINQFTIDLSKVPAGAYFLQVKGLYVNNIQKLQKL